MKPWPHGTQCRSGPKWTWHEYCHALPRFRERRATREMNWWQYSYACPLKFDARGPVGPVQRWTRLMAIIRPSSLTVGNCAGHDPACPLNCNNHVYRFSVFVSRSMARRTPMLHRRDAEKIRFLNRLVCADDFDQIIGAPQQRRI